MVEALQQLFLRKKKTSSCKSFNKLLERYLKIVSISIFMGFSKKFPREKEGSNYPVWEEIFLDEIEDKSADQECRKENKELMKECINDAREISKDLKDYQSDIIHLAIALFEKRASHSIYWKESKAKEKFDKKVK